MNSKGNIKLNVGAGKTHIPGFINIDISSKADISLNLSEEKLPFEDDSVDIIFSYHTLEHVPNYLHALSEIYRVLKNGGILLVGVPYVTLTEFHLVNPYHLHNFNEHSFSFFDPRKLKGSAEEANAIKFSKIFHRYHYIGFFNLMPPPIRGWCRRHLFNVVRKIDFGMVAVKSETDDLINVNSAQLLKMFDDLMESRIPYGQKVNRPRSAIRKIYSWWRGH
jgi:SAM-dependent methyltransferase